jgi:NAD(P)-dependent dehydrogenase (short-subunit alcohol dehydrogenase family)
MSKNFLSWKVEGGLKRCVEEDNEGKVAIVTGSASGIGEAAVKILAENGCRLQCWITTRHAWKRWLREVQTLQEEFFAVGGDVTEEKHCY